MNQSVSGSRSCSNLRDLRAVQPTSCHIYDYPPCDDGYPVRMTPEQAIAENYYDVPRPVNRVHRRSNSHGGTHGWRIQLHDSIEGSSSGVASPTGVVEVTRKSMSAPSSPVIGSRTPEGFGVMSPRDQSIYRSLGSSSSKLGKPSFAQLGLMRDVRKIGIMSKTGPTPSWVSKWKRRVFILKDNFLFYFDPVDKPMASAPVLGGVYIKDSIIERISMPFAKRVLRITPPVARREGWSKENETGMFYIKFRTEDGRNQWYDALMSTSLGHEQTPAAAQ